jgi:UDPglucose 6-dehydrogenase
MKIGFIGQGYVGYNTANDFEERGLSVVRYSLEAEYIVNKEKIKDCDIVFVAVPTPSTPKGFDYSIVEGELSLVGEGKIAVIKSTLLPGITDALRKKYPSLTIVFSPEFLCEATAARDAREPIFTILGIEKGDERYEAAAQTLLTVLPKGRSTHIVPTRSAELFKYIHNIHGYARVVLANMFYDLGTHHNVDWSDVEAMMNVDPMMSPYYNSPVHKSGRGAGGHCFIKDMAAFRGQYEEQVGSDALGITLLKALEEKNRALLKETGKDQDLLRGVYGA